MEEVFKWAVKTVTPNDNILIYFSGHGEYDEDFDTGYWIPIEANLRRQFNTCPVPIWRNTSLRLIVATLFW